MNTKQCWYVGARRNAPYVVFQSRTKPTEDSHGFLFGFVFGPYASENQAITTARYQAYGAFPVYGYERGTGWQFLNCYKA